MNALLNIKNLMVSFGDTVAVSGVSFHIHAGEIVALVGESGSGKSVTAQSILRLNSTAETTADTLSLLGHDILTMTEKELDQLRGGGVGMVFQDPAACLNPTMKVGNQITERLYRRKELSRSQCRAEAVRLLKQVRIPDAALRAQQYPHQLSGGMRQRSTIAMALACQPQLLIADEPTTSLDVTTQLHILKLLAEIRKDFGTAVLLITHDLEVVGSLADRAAVMYAGKIVEEISVASLFERALHPYTQTLMADSIVKDCNMPIDAFENDARKRAAGCPFAGRCQSCMRICLREEPPLFQAESGHYAACWHLHSRVQKENMDGEIT